MIYTREERLLTIDKLGLQYGEKVIFRDLSLEIDNIVRPGMNQGQVVSLLGPSGIGKTQLFRCIAGLQQATTGTVLLNEVKSPVHAGDVGVVFQNYPLLQHRTILKNLQIAAKAANKKQEEITELLTTFDLAGKVEKLYPCQLSGGQQQRVAIIQQLLCSTHFILMDEPFSGLDVIMKKRAVELIQKVSTTHELNTIIVTTHDIATAIEISDTLWVLGREPEKAGATIIKKFDLIERGLAWNPHVDKHPNFYPLVLEINELFKSL